MNLKNYLDVNQLSYSEIAKILDVSRMTVKNWADGKNKPSVEHALKIQEITLGAVPCEAWK